MAVPKGMIAMDGTDLIGGTIWPASGQVVADPTLRASPAGSAGRERSQQSQSRPAGAVEAGDRVVAVRVAGVNQPRAVLGLRGRQKLPRPADGGVVRGN